MAEEIELLFLAFVEDFEIVFRQVGNKPPFSSVTVTGTMTSFTETLIGPARAPRGPAQGNGQQNSDGEKE
jgi:hypothetical protein